ncbi:carbohydrate ABC transporter permease [Ectobacillus funiculus]|uniref:carbohydrate ABC transporter permease n=1 Tax=Ectobacillus funiculus TaxID=137993 RepID=UPI00397DE0E9
MKKDRVISTSLLYIVGIIMAVIFLFPFYFSTISAFKTNGEIMRNALSLPTEFYLESFKFLFAETNFPKALLNSAFLTFAAAALQVIIIPMAAYAIERNANKWTNALYVFFLCGMMIPFQVYMVPLFKQLKVLGLYGNLAGPLFVYLAGSVGFGVLLYTSFLKGIPREIEEAAEIDGCSRVGIYWRIVFPLLGPCTASMVVLNGLGVWNDFLMPLLVLPSDKPQTIMVEIYKFVGEFSTRWDMVFAGSFVSIIPVLIIFLFLQKYFIKGVASGATKG